jgi:hypothetical protein
MGCARDEIADARERASADAASADEKLSAIASSGRNNNNCNHAATDAARPTSIPQRSGLVRSMTTRLSARPGAANARESRSDGMGANGGEWTPPARELVREGALGTQQVVTGVVEGVEAAVDSLLTNRLEEMAQAASGLVLEQLCEKLTALAHTERSKERGNGEPSPSCVSTCSAVDFATSPQRTPSGRARRTFRGARGAREEYDSPADFGLWEGLSHVVELSGASHDSEDV